MSDERDGRPGIQKILAMHVGVVVDVQDPEGLGRVRVRIPGLIEPASGWALPLGGPGGGSRRRGMFIVPPVDSEVAVLFNGGDPDHPYYLPANWGRGEVPGIAGGYGPPQPDGTPGAPEDVAPADVPLVGALETGRWIFAWDDRPGRRRLFIENKLTGDHLRFDGEAAAIELFATAVLRLRTDGNLVLDGNNITIGDRPVAKNGKPL